MRVYLKSVLPVAALAATSVAASLSAAIGVSAQEQVAQAALTREGGPVMAGRPMDDLGARYGDLSVFDDIDRIGADQPHDIPYCDRRPLLLRTLSEDFAEAPVAQSPLDAGRRVELWASDVMGTWTAVYTRADGVSCVVSSGVDWQRSTDPVALLEQEGLLG